MPLGSRADDLLPPRGVPAGGARPLGPGLDEPAALDVAALIRRLAKGWWLMALALAVMVGAALVWLQFAPRMFVSVATVRVEQERRGLLPGTSNAGAGEDIRSLEMVKTIEQGIISQDNLRRVLERLQLTTAPGFAPDGSEAAALRTLSRRARSELRRGTRLIDVRVEDTDPDRARRIASALVDEYIASSSTEAMQSARRAAEQLRDAIRRLETQIGETDGRIQAYRETHRDLPLDKDASMPAEKVRDLSTRLAQTVAERTRLNAARQEIAALGPNPDVDAVLKVQGAVAGEDVTGLKSTLAQKEAEFARLQQRYLPRHPKYLQASTELTSLRRRFDALGTEAASTLAAASAQLATTERSLREQIDRAQNDALAVEAVAGPYRLLRAQLAGDQASFDALQSQLKLAEVAATAAPAVISLADAPYAATKPAKPNRPLVLALAAGGGGVLGLCLVLLGACFRSGYDSAEEMERHLRLPALAVIPATGVSTRSLALLDNPRVDRTCSQAFFMLRSALSLVPRRADPHSLLFISATTGEGTSFVAANHALALARQGYRTLLIDANLQAPSLDDVFFAGQNADGLANYLEGRTAAGQACRPTHVSELFLLSAGRVTRHQAELFDPSRIQPLLADAGRWFHRVVIDAPALDHSNDGALLAQVAGQVVLVVNARTATRRATAAGVRRLALAGVRPAGFVANHCSGGSDSWVPAWALVPPVSSAIRS